MWSPDGEKICIVYEDGAAIVGSLDGNRLWGKDLANSLLKVLWTPDAQHILMFTEKGKVKIFNSEGIDIESPDFQVQTAQGVKDALVDISWYEGSFGYRDIMKPSLAIGFKRGSIQLSRGCSNTDTTYFDIEFCIRCVEWNTNGTILAVAGISKRQDILFSSEDRVSTINSPCIHFYGHGEFLLAKLDVPGTEINSISWSAQSLKISIAVDSFLFFANVRHLWCADYGFSLSRGGKDVTFLRRIQQEHSLSSRLHNSTDLTKNTLNLLVGSFDGEQIKTHFDKSITVASLTDEQKFRELAILLAERAKLSKDIGSQEEFLRKSRDISRIIEFYKGQNKMKSLVSLVDQLPEGNEYLSRIGEHFASCGYAKDAAVSFVKAGEYKKAIDTCIIFNEWEVALKLATEHDYLEIVSLLSEQASELLASGDTIQAIQLLKKLPNAAQAASAIYSLGGKELQKGNFLSAKKLFVMSARVVDTQRKEALQTEMRSLTQQNLDTVKGKTKRTTPKQKTAGSYGAQTEATLNTLIEQDQVSTEGKLLDAPWKAAEALHLFLLAQRQLFQGNLEAAQTTANVLLAPIYLEYLGAVRIHALNAICAIYIGSWKAASMAFGVVVDEVSAISSFEETYVLLELSIKLFGSKEVQQYLSGQGHTDAPSRRSMLVCTLTGQPIEEKEDISLILKNCHVCGRKSYENQRQRARYCPLCHTQS
eukprot:augustus_masked-scaffold_2-processed-gene-9.7-mRNA-1 protein AED:0.21 eAED:0.21 QI:0/0/0/1/1/1/2/0/705